MRWNLQKNPADARPADPPHSSVVVAVHNATMPFELPTPAAEICGGNGGGLLLSIPIGSMGLVYLPTLIP